MTNLPHFFICLCANLKLLCSIPLMGKRLDNFYVPNISNAKTCYIFLYKNMSSFCRTGHFYVYIRDVSESISAIYSLEYWSSFHWYLYLFDSYFFKFHDSKLKKITKWTIYFHSPLIRCNSYKYMPKVF